MATRPKAVIESRNGEKFSPITITKNVLTDDGQNLHDILSDRKEDMMTPTIENSSSMFKVGQGDNVDYSSNVVNSAYESMVLKGKTMVNLAQSTKSANLNGEYVFRDNFEMLNFGCNMIKPSTTYTIISNIIENSANFLNLEWNTTLDECAFKEIIRTDGSLGIRKFKVTSKDDLSNASTSIRFFPNNKQENGTLTITFMILEGDYTNIDIPYFEGMCDSKSPILSNVGKNLFDGVSYIDGFIASGNNYTVSPDTDVTSILVNVNKNTDYTLSAKTSFNRSLVGGSLEPISIGTKTTNLNAERVSNTIKFNSGEYTNIIIYLNSSKIDIEDIQVEEGSVSTTYEPYKSNILSCNGDKIKLTEDMFEQGHCGYNPSVIGSTYENFKNSSSTSMQANRVRSKALIKIKPNTKYFIKTDSTKFKLGVQGFDANKLSMGYDTNWKTSDIFTTPANMHYAGLHVCKNNNEDLTPTDLDFNFIQLSEVDKTIVLRSLPNGVCDTLNVETGEYIQNVVDIVLDGTENWILNNWGTDDNFCSFEISSSNNAKIQNVYKQNSYINFYCDTFKVLTNCNWNYMSEKHIRQWSDGNRTTISVIIPKTELRTYDVTGFVEYLTKNNIRINIRANNPIISTVDIQGFPYAYTNGHVQLSSGSIGQSLTPKVEYSVVTNRNGQIRSNQKMVERHQKQLDRLQAMILTNLINTQYEQTLTNLKYDLKNVREEVK